MAQLMDADCWHGFRAPASLAQWSRLLRASPMAVIIDCNVVAGPFAPLPLALNPTPVHQQQFTAGATSR
jgi:hypothetical protein